MSLPIVDADAPATRLAAFRVIAGVFSLGYLVIRFPVLTGSSDRSAAAFDGVGVLALLDEPLPSWVLLLVAVAGVMGGIGVVVGRWYRASAITFAVCMLVLTTARSSWGQLLHFENLIVLQLAVLAVAPAADAWSLDARRNEADGPDGETVARTADGSSRSGTRYGWPLAMAGLITVVTYVIAGIAKLRYGGWDWIAGDTLRNHIAYSAARLDLIGGNPAPFAEIAVRNAWILPTFAAFSVVLELAAPVAFLGGRVRNVWVVCTWLMHATIFATMYVGFPSPLFGVAFAPFFALEHLRDPLDSAWSAIRRRTRHLSPGV